MKRILLFVLSLNISFASMAQSNWGNSATDSIVCFEKFNTFGSLYNSKSYVDAYEPWRAVYETCPKASEVIYRFAPKILDAKIKETTDPTQREALIRLLLSTYDQRNAYFPGKEAEVNAQKADNFWTYYPDKAEEAYAMYKEVFALDPKALQPAYLNYYFNVVIKLYNDE